MGLYDNPSADKFGPPPGSSEPEPKPTGPSTGRRIVSVILLFPILKFAVQHYGGHAWWAGGALLAILCGESFVAHRRRVERGDSPYSEDQHVTR